MIERFRRRRPRPRSARSATSGRARTSAPRSELGNYAEVKNSRLGRASCGSTTSAIIGDADVGARHQRRRGHDHGQLRRRARSTARRSANGAFLGVGHDAASRRSIARRRRRRRAPGRSSPGTSRRASSRSASRLGSASRVVSADRARVQPADDPALRPAPRTASRERTHRRHPAAPGPDGARGVLRRRRDRARLGPAQPRRAARRGGQPARQARAAPARRPGPLPRGHASSALTVHRLPRLGVRGREPRRRPRRGCSRAPGIGPVDGQRRRPAHRDGRRWPCSRSSSASSCPSRWRWPTPNASPSMLSATARGLPRSPPRPGRRGC